MYRVEYDVAANLMRIHVAGFWKPEDVPAFAKTIGEAAHAARAIRSDYNVLVESLDFPVQAKDVADLLGNVMAGGSVLTTGWFAIVVASHLNRMQVERTLIHPRLRAFMSVAEGEAWLQEVTSGLHRKTAGAQLQ